MRRGDRLPTGTAGPGAAPEARQKAKNRQPGPKSLPRSWRGIASAFP